MDFDFTRNIIDRVIYHLYKDDPKGFPKYNKYKLTKYDYAQFVEGWDDARPVPTEQTIMDTENEIQEKHQLKHPSYYKLANKHWVLDSSKKQQLREAINLVYDLDAEGKVNKNKNKIILGIDEDTTESQFLTLLFESNKAEALTNSTKKTKLNNKTMQELMDIYNAL